MCHIGQTFMFLASFQNGACTIQPSAVTFSPDELAHMITHGGLNRLNQFPAFLAVHVRAARKNPKLLALLRGLAQRLRRTLDAEDAHRFAVRTLSSGWLAPRDTQGDDGVLRVQVRCSLFFCFA